MRDERNRAIRHSARRSAFTIIEIVLVLAVIAILASLAASFAPSFSEKSRRDRAAGDLAVIQQGLEAYRRQFGDYPRYPDSVLDVTSNEASAYLFNALNGRYGPSGDTIDFPSMLKNGLLELEISGLPVTGPLDNRILDPWQNPYVYDDAPLNEDNKPLFGYELYSLGPDGTDDTGDEIYAK